MDASERAKGRYKLLIQQIGEELEHERGWKERAAEKLGVKGAFISMVLSGERSGELDAISKAIDGVPLDPLFFFGTFDREPHYKPFVVKKSGPPPKRTPDPAYWSDFVSKYDRIKELSAEQLEDIRTFAARRWSPKSWIDLERIAEMVRTSPPIEDDDD
jgi:hypothetical protein